MSQSTIFQSYPDGASASWVLPVFSGSKHNTAEVGFKPIFLAPESDALPLSHHAPPVGNTTITKFQKCTLS